MYIYVKMNEKIIPFSPGENKNIHITFIYTFILKTQKKIHIKKENTALRG